ncbi:MAG: LssY C-terminal domain-containing protein [Bryobacteraceae bacterium]|nr:LssY C-terminal domain-containing protein [Bryobacteraceae bacterium]
MLCAAEPRLAPAGTAMEVRLRQPVASYSSKSGTPVEARVVAPVHVDGRTLVPVGSWVRGELAEVRKVGLGFRRGRASLAFDFDTLELPDGTTFPIKTRLTAVDTARESVDDAGRVQGIRATDAFGHRMAGITRNIFFWDPLVHSVLTGTTLAVIRFPEAEIHLPAGTELRLELTEALELRGEWTVPLPMIASSTEEREDLLEIVRAMTYRSRTGGGRREADLVNMVLLGEEEWVRRAFDAAGWVEADGLTKATGWATFRSVAESKAYPEAPMSLQTLDELPPVLELSKALNTYSKRHHARIWSQPDRFRGRPVYAVAATEDTAIDFSFKRMRLIHTIDPNLDNERAKIVNDLVEAGCVDAAELIERPWAPREFRNATGEKVFTDARLLVVEMNPCRSPQLVSEEEGEPLRIRGRWYQRVPRQIILTIRNDFTRNNPVFQAALGVRYLIGKTGANERRRTRPDRLAVESAPIPMTTAAQ